MTPPLLTLPAAAAQCKPNSGPDNVDAIKRFFLQDIEANAAAGQKTLSQLVKVILMGHAEAEDARHVARNRVAAAQAAQRAAEEARRRAEAAVVEAEAARAAEDERARSVEQLDALRSQLEAATAAEREERAQRQRASAAQALLDELLAAEQAAVNEMVAAIPAKHTATIISVSIHPPGAL